MESGLTCIIILNWNGLGDTRKCLDYLLRVVNVNFKIMVIDNGSRNNEAAILKKEYGNKIEVFPLKENLGFSGGVNYGTEQAKKYNPTYFLLLNNDVEVDKNFLKFLLETASKNKKIGIVGSCVFDYTQRNKILYSGGEMNWFLAKPFHKTDLHNNIRKEKFVTGCSMLIKKEVVDKVGLLDDNFFAYFEDTAFCFRARESGFECVSDPRSKVYHKESSSTGKEGVLHTYLMSRNRILFVNKYLPPIYRIYFVFFNFGKLMFALLYFLSTLKNRRAYVFLKGYIDGTFGMGGKPTI